MYKINKNSPIYFLPSLITLGAMFAGFSAIIYSLNSKYIDAGIAIFVALILDAIDGRIARLTNTSSSFGSELDSLADIVSFGIAPAVIVFNWELHVWGKVGWLVAFVYCACAGLRLARFNSSASNVNTNFFIGLPSPAAAMLVVGYIYLCTYFKLEGTFYIVWGSLITIFAAVSMITTVKFYSFRKINYHQKVRFKGLLLFFMILMFFISFPELVIYLFFLVYVVGSYFNYIFKIGYYKKIVNEKIIETFVDE
jgi:CDP-diacylglycerol--serine O-phosphatidyltransferase